MYGHIIGICRRSGRRGKGTWGREGGKKEGERKCKEAKEK